MPVGFWWGSLLLIPLVGAYSVLGARGQNWLLVATGMLLMASWDVRFPIILVGTTALAYGVGRKLSWERPDARRRLWFCAGLGMDLAVLLGFRYAAHQQVADSAGLLDLAGALRLRGLVAPVGLSFYTLARMTHTFDVYYRFERPCRSFLEFLTFTSFFPLLVSGPIERSTRILPLLARRRSVDAEGIYRGAWLILLGLFEKVVVADHCGALVGTFSRPHPGTVLTLLQVAAYSIQIFADFSGYSDIARGVARLLGIEVMTNFRAPYLSRSLPEYWRRWHISLSTWLEDYVYKPTGMWLRNFGLLGAFGATAFTFFISATWHGRGWTFLCWGAIHVAGITAFMATSGFRKRLKSRLPAAPLRVFSTLLTFATICLAYVFFRAPDVGSALSTLAELSRLLPLNLPDVDDGLEFLALVIAVAGVHHIQLKGDADWIQTRPVWMRAACYTSMLFLIVRLPGSSQAFIYFQF